MVNTKEQDFNIDLSNESSEFKCVIESLINFYKIQHMKEWEKDHNTKAFNSEIKKLKLIKNNIKSVNINIKTK